MKKVIILFSLFVLILPVTLSFAETCEIDGSEGSWLRIRLRQWNYYNKNPWPTDYSCDAEGSGTLISESNGNYTYELKQGDLRFVEVVDACTGLRTCSEDGGHYNDYRACTGHLDDTNPCFRRVWPACLVNDEERFTCYSSTEDCIGGCRNFCQKCSDDGLWFAKDRYGVMTCGTRSYCLSPVVYKREAFQWVCNDCSQAYRDLKTYCGSAENIADFDNSTCSGTCKEDPEKNQGKECQKEEQ